MGLKLNRISHFNVIIDILAAQLTLCGYYPDGMYVIRTVMQKDIMLWPLCVAQQQWEETTAVNGAVPRDGLAHQLGHRVEHVHVTDRHVCHQPRRDVPGPPDNCRNTDPTVHAALELPTYWIIHIYKVIGTSKRAPLLFSKQSCSLSLLGG